MGRAAGYALFVRVERFEKGVYYRTTGSGGLRGVRASSNMNMGQKRTGPPVEGPSKGTSSSTGEKRRVWQSESKVSLL
eukprot:9485315-Pyramimonas_sp.AAC.2